MNYIQSFKSTSKTPDPKTVGSDMRARLAWGKEGEENKEWFTAIEVFTTITADRIAFVGVNSHDDSNYTSIWLWLPLTDLKPGHIEIGDGEHAEVGAYFGSLQIPYSGYAKSGEIDIKEWDASLGYVYASFKFIVPVDGLAMKVEEATFAVRGLPPSLFEKTE